MHVTVNTCSDSVWVASLTRITDTNGNMSKSVFMRTTGINQGITGPYAHKSPCFEVSAQYKGEITILVAIQYSVCHDLAEFSKTIEIFLAILLILLANS